MNLQELLEKYKNLPKKYLIVAIPAGFGLIFFVYGLITLFGQNQASGDIAFEQASINRKEDKKRVIIVDVEGAVVHPGVYKLPDDARVQDVLVKAGGLSEHADRKWIAKNINLATKLTDGGKIFIPSVGEVISADSTTGSTGMDSLININSATIKELDNLSGIGLVTAEKIISNRPYQSIEQLLTKKVIGRKVFNQIKNRITL